MVSGAAPAQLITIGRYALHSPIAWGGMATVYLGRALGPVGFRRIVAIKRMHPHLAQDPEFVAMFFNEASLAARIQHPNVASTLDVVALEGEVVIVLEYIRGESLIALLRAARKAKSQTPIDVIGALLVGTLAGLHAAHEARGDDGQLLGIIHRDVSPPNVLVGIDGLPRLVDFGIAKAATRLEVTREGQFKGKLGYAAPEQLVRTAQTGGAGLDRRVDVFAAGAILWELLAGRRLFLGDDDIATIGLVIRAEVPPLRAIRSDVSPELEAVVRKALARDRDERYATAEEFALALEAVVPVAKPRAVSEWVRGLASDVLIKRDALVVELENSTMASSGNEAAMAQRIARGSLGSSPMLLRSEGVGEAAYGELTQPGAPPEPSLADVPVHDEGTTGAVVHEPVVSVRPLHRRIPVLVGAGAALSALVLLLLLSGRGETPAEVHAATSSAVVQTPVPAAPASVEPAPAVTAAPSASEATVNPPKPSTRPVRAPAVNGPVRAPAPKRPERNSNSYVPERP